MTCNNDKRVNSEGRYPILNLCAADNRVIKYVKQKLTEPKGEIEKSTIIIGDLKFKLWVASDKISWKYFLKR